jgi:hypothetical protein
VALARAQAGRLRARKRRFFYWSLDTSSGFPRLVGFVLDMTAAAFAILTVAFMVLISATYFGIHPSTPTHPQ